MITGLFTSRVRVLIGSGLSMAATDLASAKLSTMLASAKVVSMNATKLVATKVVAKVTAIWMLFMSVFVPIHQTVPVVKPATAIHHKVVTKSAAPVVSKETPADKPENPLFLHTFDKEYIVLFTGKISCGEGACRTADIQIRLASKKNLSMTKSVTMQPDGTYSASFTLKEAPQEHIDWWIVADSPDSASKQIQGREILMEDANITVEEPVSLL